MKQLVFSAALLFGLALSPVAFAADEPGECATPGVCGSPGGNSFSPGDCTCARTSQAEPGLLGALALVGVGAVLLRRR